MSDSYIYSRWLRKELSEEELKGLKDSGELDALEKIVKEADSWELPELKEDSFSGIRERISSIQEQNAETKVIPLKNRYFRPLSLAASIAAILTVAYFLFFSNHSTIYQCQPGQKLTVNLSDNTVVKLNGLSSLSIDKDDFPEQRIVKLTGEGYFEVRQKGEFKVVFHQGEVEVLGTRFNILSGSSISSIKCFEGTVKVVDNYRQQSQILSPGKGLRIQDSGAMQLYETSEKVPDWLAGSSSFKEAPLSEVINALTIQYDVVFDSGDIDLNRKYSGKFIHSDLDTALDMVFTPMRIKYSIEYSGKKPVGVILTRNTETND